ncbi:hypothetical protein EDL99_11075 [Ornithobacterium rhinotracheale]|nr:hypothetical protein [Ornithobacterium rhinotracheale]
MEKSRKAYTEVRVLGGSKVEILKLKKMNTYERLEQIAEKVACYLSGAGKIPHEIVLIMELLGFDEDEIKNALKNN